MAASQVFSVVKVCVCVCDEGDEDEVTQTQCVSLRVSGMKICTVDTKHRQGINSKLKNFDQNKLIF